LPFHPEVSINDTVIGAMTGRRDGYSGRWGILFGG
jgi:hypothetical protein